MKYKLIYPIAFIIFGLTILIFPNILQYLDTSSFFFDFSSFLHDYPSFYIPFGIALLIVGFLALFFDILNIIRANTSFIIMKTYKNIYGNFDLRFPKFYIGNRDEIVFDSFLDERPRKSILNLEVDRLQNFYSNQIKRRVAFLGVCQMPILVYAGYLLGDIGKKVTYFHWNRSLEQVIKIRKRKKSIELLEDGKVSRKSNEHVVCISSSYEINKKIVKKQFYKYNLMFYKTNRIGVDTILSTYDISALSLKIRDVLAGLSNKGDRIHLLLSCSPELCIDIGRKLKSPVFQDIYIYNFNAKCKTPWDWKIKLGNTR